MHIWTFLQENLIQTGSWLNILSGLLVTLRISVLSILCGSLLAVPLCMLRMAKRRWLSLPAQGYIAVMRGTPVLMLLMLLYYVVFATSRIDASWIAVVAFSLHAAATFAEVFRSALASVAPGQADAAFALGMRRIDIFRFIVLPQASEVGLPVYQNAVINLIQWTSVVGYISVTDLTRAINFISARTMQPLFMLFLGILLYLLLSYLTYGVFALLSRRKRGIAWRYDRRPEHD